MRPITKFIRFFLPASFKQRFDELRLGYVMVTKEDSYLKQTGFIASRTTQTSFLQDADGPVPWMNYPVISWLKENIKPSHRIFEYGSGSSSLFFAGRASSVVSIEHDEEWYYKVKKALQSFDNAVIHHISLGPDYAQAASRYSGEIDLLIIDGRDRVECIEYGVAHLSKEGIVLLDDSDLPHCQEGLIFLKSKGFKKLTLKGLKPVNLDAAETSIFYRSQQNCFGL